MERGSVYKRLASIILCDVSFCKKIFKSFSLAASLIVSVRGAHWLKCKTCKHMANSFWDDCSSREKLTILVQFGNMWAWTKYITGWRLSQWLFLIQIAFYISYRGLARKEVSHWMVWKPGRVKVTHPKGGQISCSNCQCNQVNKAQIFGNPLPCSTDCGYWRALTFKSEVQCRLHTEESSIWTNICRSH